MEGGGGWGVEVILGYSSLLLIVGVCMRLVYSNKPIINYYLNYYFSYKVHDLNYEKKNILLL